MPDKQQRLAFSAAYKSFLGAVEHLGKNGYNLLHNPERDALLEDVADKLDGVVATAQVFDGKAPQSKVTLLRPDQKKDQE